MRPYLGAKGLKGQGDNVGDRRKYKGKVTCLYSVIFITKY